ncbi:MAG: MFS transporter [Chloroflexota bacterium]
MNRDLRLVTASLFVWGIGEGMFLYFQPLYLQQLGADPVQIGAVLGAASLAMTVAHIPAGALADHLGRKQLMLASWTLGLVSTWVMFLARSLPLFIVGLLAYWTTSFVMSPMASYITAARGGWSVGRALTTVSAGFNLGATLGPLAGGQIAEHLGLRAVYGAAAVLFIFSCLAVVAIRPQATEPHDGGSRYRALLTRQRFLGFLGLASAVVFGLYLSWPLTPNFLQNVRQVTLGEIGVFGALNALGAVTLNLTLGRLTPRLAYVLAQALVGLSVLFLWRGTGVPWFALGYFLAGAFRTARSMVTATVQTLVERSEMGLAYGLAETAQGMAVVLAAPLAGLLYHQSPERPFPVALGLIAILLLVSLRLAPQARPASVTAEPGLARPADLGRETP